MILEYNDVITVWDFMYEFEMIHGFLFECDGELL